MAQTYIVTYDLIALAKSINIFFSTNYDSVVR